MEVKNLHTGNMIMNRVMKMGLKPADLARRLEYSKPGITNIMKRHTMQIDLLRKVSNVLEYNFFNEFADIPEQVDTSELEAQVKELTEEVGDSRKENGELQKEVKYLKKIVALYEKEK